jgi:hypothetical protein
MFIILFDIENVTYLWNKNVADVFLKRNASEYDHTANVLSINSSKEERTVQKKFAYAIGLVHGVKRKEKKLSSIFAFTFSVSSQKKKENKWKGVMVTINWHKQIRHQYKMRLYVYMWVNPWVSNHFSWKKYFFDFVLSESRKGSRKNSWSWKKVTSSDENLYPHLQINRGLVN